MTIIFAVLTVATVLVLNKHIHKISTLIFPIPEKYWVHRVNSPQKLKEVGKYYAGLELDLIYHEKEQAYENSHDMVSLEKYNLCKTLDAYVQLGRKNKLWLDCKNLTEENMISARKTLDNILTQYDISKSQCLIESTNHNALKDFKDNGYIVSYYFSPKDKTNLNKYNDFIVKLSHSGLVDMISFDYMYHNYIISLPISKKSNFLLGKLEKNGSISI